MSSENSLSRYLEAQAKLRVKDKAGAPPTRPFVTISREAGAGARTPPLLPWFSVRSSR